MRDDALTAAIARVFIAKAKTMPGATESLSDDEVIGLVRAGKIEAFGTLVKRHEDFVFTLARGMVISEEAAKDIAQEVFLRAYRAIRRFEQRSSFKTWLYRIAYNTSMNHLKRLEKTTELNEDWADKSETENLPLKIALRKLVEMLKPELKAVIIFHYFDDLKYEEIAEIMNCPVGTVKIRLFRAKHDLKLLWDRYAIQLP